MSTGIDAWSERVKARVKSARCHFIALFGYILVGES